MKQPITVRRMESGDISALAKAAAGDDPPRLASVTRELRDFAMPGFTSFIALTAARDGVPVGFLLLEEREPAYWHVVRIFVVESHRGMGIGRALMENAFSSVRRLKYSPPDKGGPAREEVHVTEGFLKAVGFVRRGGYHVRRRRAGDRDPGV